MGEGNGGSGFYVSRLDFLRYSLATSVGVWAGAQMPGGLGISEAEAQELFGAAAVNPARFPQSVASGDPKPNGIVLWTRVAASGTGTKRVGYRVALDDGRTDAQAFANPVLSGVVETSAARDYTVKVQLQNSRLQPFRKYRYRFYYPGSVSRTGRFKTLPAPTADVSKVRFGYISCQDYTNGFYNALFHLGKEEIDFVVHLGDYIYETTAAEEDDGSSFQGGGPPSRNFTFPGPDPQEALVLKDYQFVYKKVKSDQNLQRLHEKCAFIMIWDDHEFANDAYQTFAPDQGGDPEAGPDENPRRREAANKAWAEFNPVGVYYNPSKSPVEEIAIYRSFAFGNLMELVMTDQRLYRDGPPAGNRIQDRYVTPGTGDEANEDRTLLGDGTLGVDGMLRADQLEYFIKKITRSPRTWKLWGNEVTFMQNKVANASAEDTSDGAIPVQSLEELFGAAFANSPAGQAISEKFPSPSGPPEGVYITLDQWDGYQAERRRITQAFKGVENFVTLTGDIHSYIAGYIKEDYDRRDCLIGNEPVGIELVCPSVTSSNLTEIATMGFGAAPVPDAGQFTTQIYANNNHIKYFNSNDHGYNVVEVRKDALVCEMKRVVPKNITINTDPTNPRDENFNNGSGIREKDPNNTRSEVLRRFKVPAGRVLLIDVTNEAIEQPLDCTTGGPSVTPGETTVPGTEL